MTALVKLNFEPSKVNLLLSLSAEMQGDNQLVEKYKATGMLMYMRLSGSVQDSGLIKG